jgi:hypothetical protein
MTLGKYFIFVLMALVVNLKASEADFENEMRLSHRLCRIQCIGDNKIFYYQLHLELKNKIPFEEARLVAANCYGNPTSHAKLKIDKEKKVWILDETQEMLLDDFEFALGNLLEGESVDFIIMDDRCNFFASTRICPKPIEQTMSDGAFLSLQLRSQDGTYMLEGSGFKPNEKISILSKSEEEVISPFALEANADGTFLAGVNPHVIGKSYGHASLLIQRDNGIQSKLSYLWGIPEEKLALK